MASKQRVLIADDEAFIRKLCSRLLKYEGFDVIQAENGVKAIEKYNENSRDLALVILDIRMPGKTGIDVHRFIAEQNPEMRIIFCSGYGEDSLPDEQEIFFIQKPFSIDVFIDSVKRVLSASSEDVVRNNRIILDYYYKGDSSE